MIVFICPWRIIGFEARSNQRFIFASADRATFIFLRESFERVSQFISTMAKYNITNIGLTLS